MAEAGAEALDEKERLEQGDPAEERAGAVTVVPQYLQLLSYLQQLPLLWVQEALVGRLRLQMTPTVMRELMVGIHLSGAIFRLAVGGAVVEGHLRKEKVTS